MPPKAVRADLVGDVDLLSETKAVVARDAFDDRRWFERKLGLGRHR